MLKDENFIIIIDIVIYGKRSKLSMNIEYFLKSCFSQLEDDTIRLISEVSSVRHFKKGEKLIEAGQIQNYIPILIEGVFRGYLVGSDGKETTDCFAYKAGDVVMSCNKRDKPSVISVEALAESLCLMVPVAACVSMEKSKLDMLLVRSVLLSDALEAHWKSKVMLQQCSAQQRYEWFLNTYPGLYNRVNDKYIASFLGMTPVTLSRLRGKLKNESSEKN